MILDAGTYELALQKIFTDEISVVSKRPISGGSVNQAYGLDLNNGKKVFLKTNDSKYTDMFIKEAQGLACLYSEQGPRVPDVLAAFCGNQKQFLLLEFIEYGKPGEKFWEEFAVSLYHLHHTRAKSYGLDHNNFIGSTIQINNFNESWIDFFRVHRLEFQYKLAESKGLTDSKMMSMMNRLLSKLDDFLAIEDRFPSPLHGDLWSGNFMVDQNGSAVLVDPAFYYGDYETDLAMTKLFGGFEESFYSVYKDLGGLSYGYDLRKEIYQLYHILNHLNLFGSAYYGQVISILSKFQ